MDPARIHHTPDNAQTQVSSRMTRSPPTLIPPNYQNTTTLSCFAKPIPPDKNQGICSYTGKYRYHPFF
ncbi:uncharacterized protein L199_001839 [Kwoniella botswanensis]|uniref:uncharacterized protein n=1 Tax=Kwoniella botswanensis TaxID=1268659 RepID=UPI00315D8ABB